jgi:hypothetical protein
MTARISRLVLALLACALGLDLGAQEEEKGKKREKPSFAARFFDRPIDYWGRGLEFEEKATPDPRLRKAPEDRRGEPAPDFEWGRGIPLSDGMLPFHELPRPLVRVLEDPTPGNIRAYFEWRIGRIRKILRAAELMKEYRASVLDGSGKAPGETDRREHPRGPAPAGPKDGGEGAPSPPPEAPEAPGKPAPFKVTYFHRTNCPHCETQDALLARWLAGKPEGTLDVVEFGMEPGLWKAHRIRGTPSLLLEDGGTRRTVVLEGVSRADDLERALGECRRGVRRPSPAEGGRTK